MNLVTLFYLPSAETYLPHLTSPLFHPMFGLSSVQQKTGLTTLSGVTAGCTTSFSQTKVPR